MTLTLSLLALIAACVALGIACRNHQKVNGVAQDMKGLRRDVSFATAVRAWRREELMKDHEPDCPRAQFWDAGEYEAPCTCEDEDSLPGEEREGMR